jgi:hypothetical protein
MSGPVYEACIKLGFQINILTQNNLCHLSQNIPRLFSPLFGFDPYLYLVNNYINLKEISLGYAWKFKSNLKTNEYSDEFYLYYLASYTDLTEMVLDEIKFENLLDFDIILGTMINVAEEHYKTVGRNEIMNFSRKIQIFDPWCYMASYKEMKKDYWNIYTNSLNIKTILYTWLTVGYPLCLNKNTNNLTTLQAKKIMYLQIM